MPRIKRWFPVSHDINADPEVLELTDRFGLPGLKIWLQVLAIADRNDGVVKGDLDWICRSFLSLYTSNSRRYGTEWRRNECKMTLRWMQDRAWIDIRQDAIFVRNYLKYHITREHNPLPSYQTEPDHTKEKNKITEPPLATLAPATSPTLGNSTPSGGGKERISSATPKGRKQSSANSAAPGAAGQGIDVPDWLPTAAWDEYLAHRRHKRAKMTPQIADRLFAKLETLKNLGYRPDAVLQTCIDRNWQGLEIDWIHKPQGGSQNGDGKQSPSGFDGLREWIETRRVKPI